MEEKLIERLERAVTRLEELSSGGGVSVSSRDIGGGGDLASDQSIAAFDDLMRDQLAKVVSEAEKIGDEVLEATNALQEAFSVVRDLLIRTKLTQKPNAAAMGELIRPLHEVMEKANAMTEGMRSDLFNHQKAIAESLSALAWVAYTGKGCGMNLPIAHVEECWQAAEFYNNKVLVEYKSKDPNHLEWAKALKELYLPGLRDYVKNFYPLGPVWGTVPNPTVFAPSKSSAPGGPAAPPPPKVSISSQPSSSSSRPKEGMSAVFQEINSRNVTSGLRKVTNAMKTKNRADRSGAVTGSEKSSHRRSAAASSKVGPPKFELQMGRKWVVENQIGQKNLTIEECDSKQSVYVYGCKDSVLQILGKVNNITVDKCTKMGILFKDVVAAFEVVNCSSIEVQSQGSAPSISVDNTSGCQLYLSNESLLTSITTAKCSEINVLVPMDEGDWDEHSLPQQYAHEYRDGQFVTTAVTHSGA